jgi:ethanolamine utilization protein EutA
MFSSITLERDGKQLSSHFEVVERATLHESRPILTPFSDALTVDVQRLDGIIRGEYERAGLDPADVDTGAVIITGEAARKENAEAIVHAFSAQSGDFVCATAGPHLEAGLAAQGSGCLELSAGQTVLLLDVGGGTTKFALLCDGVIAGTGAIALGARLLAVDAAGVVQRVEPAIANYLDDEVAVGDLVGPDTMAAVAEAMAARLFEVLKDLMAGRQPALAHLLVTDSLPTSTSIDAVAFSGGVSEYVYRRETEDKGDLGQRLGKLLRAGAESLPVPLLEPRQGIRATVVGASQHTVQVSGNTISAPAGLPVRGLPVVPISWPGTDTDRLRAKLASRDLETSDRFALGVEWRDDVSSHTLGAFRDFVVGALAGDDAESDPFVLVFDIDIAASVGQIFREGPRGVVPVICIDQITTGAWDFIDIGSIDAATRTVPVVVKSLVFA